MMKDTVGAPGPARTMIMLLTAVVFLSGFQITPALGEAINVNAAPPGSKDFFFFEPTVFMTREQGILCQTVNVRIRGKGPAPILAVAAHSGMSLESRPEIKDDDTVFTILAPACEKRSCAVSVTLRGASGDDRHFTFDLPYQRRWKIYMSPFSHIDVGFTNSQRKILAQNLDNLRVALDLIEQTKNYPENSRFKFFTEVSWPLHEFLYGDATTPEEKNRMIQALASGGVEPGGFVISHQNKFMPAEALFRSTDQALKIGRDHNMPIRTACLNDLMDLSGIVKPLHSAGIPFFIGGTNTSRYIAPPLFYLMPPAGQEKILVWLAPNLNGYGENFDFAMRPPLPISGEALAEIEKRLGGYLKLIESEGMPPMNAREQFDFYGARWPYPYDIYFLPFYPAHAVDNGPQDLTASEIARMWNERFVYPRLVVANPAEFFFESEKNFKEQIPIIRGDLPGFWGEQVFMAFAQVDPKKETGQRQFERNVKLYEARAVKAMLTGARFPDLSEKIAEGYKLIALNNDHNPGPVPFGHASYNKNDVIEWKKTRQEWVARIDAIGQEARAVANDRFPIKERLLEKPPLSVSVTENNDSVIMENEFFRATLDKKTGGLSSLFDKELGLELASPSGPYYLNQYVVVARGENTGLRGNLFTRPGFRKVKVEVLSAGPLKAAILVSGKPARHPDAVKVPRLFMKETFGVTLPGFAIKAATRLLGARTGPVDRVEQKVELHAGVKIIYFDQHFSVDRDQIIDHAFAYHFNIGKNPLLLDGPYNPHEFSMGPPLGQGDLVPAARMTDPDFPSINDMTSVFGWMYGLPADAVFRSYVLAMGDGFGIAFSSKDSGVIFPGPVDKDPVTGPFGGGFFHLALGWSGYGNIFLGASRDQDFLVRNALTSFPASSPAEARARAAAFGNLYFYNREFADIVMSSNPDVMIVSIRPRGEKSFMVRLHDVSGRGGRTTVSLPNPALIDSVVWARSDGVDIGGRECPITGNRFETTLEPGEVATIKVTVK